MNRDSAKRLFSCLATGFLVIVMISFIGCAGSKIKIEYENKDKNKYSKKDHKHKHKKGKSSKHAKVHRHRGKHHYLYYPSSSVYFDRDRRLYYYLSHGHWEAGSSLPRSIRSGLGDYVKLELNTGMPYTYHADHCKQYPPGKKKKKKDKKKHR